VTGIARAIACAAAVLATAGCTWKTEPDGDDAGSSSSTITATVGDRCEAIASELCMKASSCAIPPASFSDCVASYKVQCCSGSSCDKVSMSTDLALTSCKQAIDAEDCNDFVNNNLPTYCSSFSSN